MSITEFAPEEAAVQMRPTKAFSWHYPNREDINSLLFVNQREQLECAILWFRLASPKVDGFGDNEKIEQSRIRLRRLNSLHPTKKSTKTNTGLNHAVFNDHEQADIRLNPISSSESHTPRKSPFKSQPRRVDLIPRHLRVFRTPSKDSLNGTSEATAEQGSWETKRTGITAQGTQSRPPITRRTLSSSSGSILPVHEMAGTTTGASKNVKLPQSSSEAKPASSGSPCAATSTTSPVKPSPSLRHPLGKIPHRPRVDPWEEPGAPKIPAGLTDQENEVYKTLIKVRRQRMFATPQPISAPRVAVITDLGKDYDDLAAMVVLKELHRIGLIELVGFITNLHPPQERAKFGRGCLDSLGLEDVPLAWGEEGQADASRRKAPEEYEFPHKYSYFSSIYAKDAIFTPYGKEKSNQSKKVEIESGVKLLDRLVYESLPPQPKGHPRKSPLTFLLISALGDISTFAKREPENLAKVTAKVVLQGNYSLQRGPTSHHAILTPDLKAANNDFDVQSAIEWHRYMDNHHIPSVVYTKTAAASARLPPSVFDMLRDTKHPVGQHLSAIQTTQDEYYYDSACDPKKRYKPDLDQVWFLRTRTNWFDQHPDDDPKDASTKPVGKEVLKYVQLVCYDALAALGTCGDDVLEALSLLKPRKPFENQGPQIHKIVGVAEVKENNVVVNPADPGINTENMKVALTALLKGSLMAVQQGIPSTHTSMLRWDEANAIAAESAAIGTGNRP